MLSFVGNTVNQSAASISRDRQAGILLCWEPYCGLHLQQRYPPYVQNPASDLVPTSTPARTGDPVAVRCWKARLVPGLAFLPRYFLLELTWGGLIKASVRPADPKADSCHRLVSRNIGISKRARYPSKQVTRSRQRNSRVVRSFWEIAIFRHNSVSNSLWQPLTDEEVYEYQILSKSDQPWVSMGVTKEGSQKYRRRRLKASLQ
jgi:hypothetical protein